MVVSPRAPGAQTHDFLPHHRELHITASGSRLAQFTVTDNAPGSPQSVALTGTGLGAPPPAPAITFTPGTLSFSVPSQGSTSPPLSVTVTNSGNAALNISAITLGGSHPADFSVPSSNCTAAPIPSGASCTITESFTPLAAGLRQAMLIFADNAAGSPQSITLIGTQVSAISGPTLKFIPTSVTFPVTTQGLASAPMLTVTVLTVVAQWPLLNSVRAGAVPPLPTALALEFGMLLFILFLRFYGTRRIEPDHWCSSFL
jgi:hypothetical protein